MNHICCTCHSENSYRKWTSRQRWASSCPVGRDIWWRGCCVQISLVPPWMLCYAVPRTPAKDNFTRFSVQYVRRTLLYGRKETLPGRVYQSNNFAQSLEFLRQTLANTVVSSTNQSTTILHFSQKHYEHYYNSQNLTFHEAPQRCGSSQH